MEKDIIEKCQQGDLNEFGKLYNFYVQKIYQFIYFKTHQKEVAEDLTSTTFMKALQGIKNFNARKASFKTWIYHIARNTVIDHYRSDHPTQDLEDAWGLKDETDIPLTTDQEMKLKAVKKYLQTLKVEQREIILLRVWGGYNFAEIAEIMGKTEAACKMTFKRSIDKLRENFAPFLILLLFTQPT